VRPGRALLVATALAATLLPATSARPEPVPPTPTRLEPAAPAETPGFWTRVAHPHRERYDELTTQGRALYEQEKPGLALDLLVEAVRLDPARPDAWWFLGMAYQRLDRFGECADALDHLQALAPGGWVPDGLRPSYPQPAFSLALCDAAAGRLEASVALLEATLAQDGLTVDAVATLTYNLGDSYQALGRLEDAIRAYRRALELRGNVPLYRFSLAVALDRDEQGARAREEMLTALAADRVLGSISQPTTIYVPPEDEDYYRGFALEVLAGSDLPRTACQPWLCRPFARVYFRRFVQRAPDGPWRARAEAHLHDLGGAAPRADEIFVAAIGKPDVPAQAAYVKVVSALVPKLQACVADRPLALLRAEIYLPGKASPPAPPSRPAPLKKGAPLVVTPVLRAPTEKSFSVQNAGPAPTDEPARLCVLNLLAGAHWPAPAATPYTVQLAVSGP
jgi:tetratricopeptide (TPR) repeat protein